MRSRRKKAPSVPASLQRSASASNRRFSLPENWRRLAIATTSGSRRAASSEAVSPVALRASSAAASEEEPNDPFIEDFSNELRCMSYLYSKLPETGVSPHIGTGGRCIGSATYKEYRQYFEKDRALVRRFQKIDVNEPTVEDAIDILKGLKPYFEEYHKLK